MKVGIKETRQKLTQLLKRVRAGETLIITDRKQPIAKIVPAEIKGAGLGSHARLREAIIQKGKPLSQLVLEDREEQ